VRGLKAYDGRVGALGETGHEVGEHRSGLHRGQLVGVPDQDEPGGRSHRLEEPGHLRQRDHRDLVDDHDVVGQRVAAVMAEAGAVVGAPAQQPVHRAGTDADQPGGVLRRHLGAVALASHRLLQPRSRLPGRGGEGDARRSAHPRFVLLAQHCQEPGDRGGLAGAGATGQDRGPLSGRPLGGVALLLPARWEHPVQGGSERELLDLGSLQAQSCEEVVADLLLLAPVPVEVEQGPLEPEHPTGDERAAAHGFQPGLLLGPGEGELGVLGQHRRSRQLEQVDAHRAQPGRSDHEGNRQPNVSGRLARERGHPGGDVDVGGIEHAGPVELGEARLGTQCEVAAGRVLDHDATSSG
jgi:hypothetical protein